MVPGCMQAQSASRGDAMKLSERTGKWVEIDKSTDADDELIIQVPDSIWAGWLSPVTVREDELASFLRSLGWRVELPASATQRS